MMPEVKQTSQDTKERMRDNTVTLGILRIPVVKFSEFDLCRSGFWSSSLVGNTSRIDSFFFLIWNISLQDLVANY